METDETVKKLLVDLDCLLDTRLSTIFHLNKDAYKTLLKNKAYYTRLTDNFELLTDGLITQEAYLKAYQHRDKERLKHSSPTRMLKVLNQISKDIEAQSVTEPDTSGLIIGVNTYPYSLTEKEQEVLAISVEVYCSPSTKVHCVSIPLLDCTPLYIRDHWDMYITYNFDHWYTPHVNTFFKVRNPRGLLYAASLFIKEPTETDIKAFFESQTQPNPFKLLEYTLLEYITIEFRDIADYCLYIEHEKVL